MPTDDVRRFADLVETGFSAVGTRFPVNVEGSTAVILDVFVEFGAAIECMRVSDPDRPFMSFPRDAIEGAAAAVCSSVLASVACRAIELAANPG